MKKLTIIAAVLAIALSACSSTPPSGPEVTPVCKDGFVNGLQGCYGQKGGN